jgi:hypothetical protein
MTGRPMGTGICWEKPTQGMGFEASEDDILNL